MVTPLDEPDRFPWTSHLNLEDAGRVQAIRVYHNDTRILIERRHWLPQIERERLAAFLARNPRPVPDAA